MKKSELKQVLRWAVALFAALLGVCIFADAATPGYSLMGILLCVPAAVMAMSMDTEGKEA